MKTLITAFFLISTGICLAQDSLNIRLLFHWKDTSIVTSPVFGNTYNDIWGFSRNGKEYAVIGTTLGAHFFDVTDPVNSIQVDFIAGAFQGQMVIHRDYHDYKGYLYMVCDEGPSSLQIADLRYLPDSVSLVYDSDVLFNTAHNIFIDTATAKLYVCGGSSQLAVYSLADPVNPILLVNCVQDVSFWPSTVGYVHDIYVRNDTAYCNAGPNGLWAVDFSNAASPQLLGSLSQYLQQGYNHSGWLRSEGKIYAMADETHGADVKIVDVTDLQDMQVIDTFDTGVHPLSIPHNLIFKDDYLYVSYYHDGLYIFNTCNPHQVTIAGFYDTSTEPHQTNYKGAWGVYPFLPSGNVLVSDMQNGLFIFDVSKALVNILINTVDVQCNGGNDGAAAVTVENGTGVYNYIWNISPSPNDSFVAQLPAGTYSVTITDENNCKYQPLITINEPSAITVEVQSSDVSSIDGSDGYAFVLASGGTSGYEIIWSGGQVVPTGDTTYNLQAGDYSVSVRDSNGCTAVDSFTIFEPVSISGNQEFKSISVKPNPFINKFEILIPNNSATGFYELMDVSGQLLMQGRIDNVQTLVEVNNPFPSGMYLLKVTTPAGSLFYKVIKGN